MNLVSTLKHAIGLSSLSNEGEVAYGSTRKRLMYHDGVRTRNSSAIGYAPFAYPIGGDSGMAATTALNLAASGGVVAFPVFLKAHMLLRSVIFRSTDTAQARGAIELAIYEDRLDNANALSLVSGAVGTLTAFTPSAASNRTIPITSPPVYLGPGLYWVCLKNNGTARTLGLGTRAAGTMALTTAQTKTLSTAAFGSTLDLVAATWTKSTAIAGCILQGSVFGESTVY